MMYIRTKNNIYQVESILRDNGFVKGYTVGEMAFLRKDQVLNQSENLEELCDEFVYCKNDFYEMYRQLDYTHYDKEYIKNGGTIKGAIWTDKGLIYVAKMNSEGKLELI